MDVGSKEIGLEVNADKSEYMVMFGDENAGRNDSIYLQEDITFCIDTVFSLFYIYSCQHNYTIKHGLKRHVST